MTPTNKHIIRVFISPGYVNLRARCWSSVEAECKVKGDNGTVCRYAQWWDEAGVFLEDLYAGTKAVTLLDGAEISIDWDGEAWVWDLEN